MKRPPAWVVAVGVAFAGCVGYPAAKVRWAARAVDGFCATVEVGAPIAGVAERAEAASLRVMTRPARANERGAIVAWEGFAFARRFCDVEHDGAVVTGKRGSSLD